MNKEKIIEMQRRHKEFEKPKQEIRFEKTQGTPHAKDNHQVVYQIVIHVHSKSREKHNHFSKQKFIQKKGILFQCSICLFEMNSTQKHDQHIRERRCRTKRK